MKTQTELLKELWEERKKYFVNYHQYCQKLKQEVSKILGKSKVLVFGSIVSGKWGPNSDIDVLIVSDNLSHDWTARRHVRTQIKSKIGGFHPFQIHLANSSEFNWYKRFIKNQYLEIP